MRLIIALLSSSFLPFHAGFGQLAYPPAAKRPVTDTYHGVAVTDDYRWLENFNDTAVKKWAAAENDLTRNFLDTLPERAQVAKELAAMYEHQGTRYLYVEQRGPIFALRQDPQHQHAVLVTMPSLDNPAATHVVLDPDALDPKHLTEIDFVSPSLDGGFAQSCRFRHTESLPTVCACDWGSRQPRDAQPL
jgi:prolyl oligopeptidase